MSFYMIELERWGIVKNSSDFTDKNIATKNSNGINNALKWAVTQYVTEVILPKGIYLIDEELPIKPPSFITFNLGGSRLRIRDNGLEYYKAIYLDNIQYSRITNGLIEGDRYTHDYSAKTDGFGTHEGGHGIVISGSKFITIDNVEVFNFTGDACMTAGKGGTMAFKISKSGFEMGSYDTTNGKPITTVANRIRYTTKLNLEDPLIKAVQSFTIGGTGYGYLGYDITATHLDVIYYNQDDTFHSSEINIPFFTPIVPPEGARWARFNFHQGTIPEDGTITRPEDGRVVPRNSLNIWNLYHPQNLYFEKLNLHHCRRQGMSLAGRFIYVRDCEIHHIKGTLPEGGIDIEDGYKFNEHFFIENNHFHHNDGYDLVITDGRQIKVTGNRFNRVSGKVTLGINEPTDNVLIAENSMYNAFVVIAGETILSNNSFYGSNIQFNSGLTGRPRQMLISDNTFLNSTVTVDINIPHLIKFNNCKFWSKNDDQSFKINSHLILNNEPQIFSDCLFEGKTTNSFIATLPRTKRGWIFTSCVFKSLTPGLVDGDYSNCRFVDSTSHILSSGRFFTFDNCNFETITNSTLFTVNQANSVKLLNCKISHNNGRVLRLVNVTDSFVMKGSHIHCLGSEDNLSILRVEPTFNGKSIIIEDNLLTSSNKRLGLEIMKLTNTSTEVVIKNNNLINATYSFQNKERLFDNIVDGIKDPYYKTTTISNLGGFFPLGTVIKNALPKPGGNIGWVTTTEGYYVTEKWTAQKIHSAGNKIVENGHIYVAQNGGASTKQKPIFPTTSGATVMDVAGTTVWEPNKNYSVGQQVLPRYSNGYFYECIAAGKTASVEPSWPTAIAATVTDGTVKWKCVRPIITWKEEGLLAEFKPFGPILE